MTWNIFALLFLYAAYFIPFLSVYATFLFFYSFISFLPMLTLYYSYAYPSYIWSPSFLLFFFYSYSNSYTNPLLLFCLLFLFSKVQIDALLAALSNLKEHYTVTKSAFESAQVSWITSSCHRIYSVLKSSISIFTFLIIFIIILVFIFCPHNSSFDLLILSSHFHLNFMITSRYFYYDCRKNWQPNKGSIKPF